MKERSIIFQVKTRFEKALEAKTGWGKNEVRKLLDETIIEVLVESLNTK